MVKDKDVAMLETLLDSDHVVRHFHYEDYFDRNNIKVVRGTYSKEERVNFLLPGNPECSEKDWWLMYAVSVLNLADAKSIARYLAKIKSEHKELYFTVEDERTIVRRLNLLSKMGFLYKFLYVAGTNIDIDDAQQAYNIKMREKEDAYVLQNEASKPVLSVDDEFMDEESLDEVEYVTYSTAAYSKYLGMKKEDSYIRGKHGYAVLNDNGYKVMQYFGKNAKLIALYGMEEDTLRFLRDRFGSNIPFNKGNIAVKLASEQMGDAAIGYVASKFMTLPTFHSVKTGRMQCKNGIFIIPIETEFRTVDSRGNTFSYNCAFYKSYYNRAVGRTLPSHDKGRIYDTITSIKNYIGVKGISKTTHDAFAIVVVDDVEDLYFFVDALVKTTNVNTAEINRIFFTGEGIVGSEIGTKKVIRIKMDENDRKNYTLETVKLPIVR